MTIKLIQKQTSEALVRIAKSELALIKSDQVLGRTTEDESMEMQLKLISDFSETIKGHEATLKTVTDPKSVQFYVKLIDIQKAGLKDVLDDYQIQLNQRPTM